VIDDFLPAYDVATRHRIEVEARRERVWQAVRELDLGQSRLIRTFFRIRGLGRRCNEGGAVRSRYTLDDLRADGFTLLAERPTEEIVLGIVGKFWRPAGPIRPTRVDEFVTFDEPGWAKAVWGFSLEDEPGAAVSVTTETRVLCTDLGSRRAFLRYWRVIRPFSELIRREALRIVRRSAQI
jgi:hypothetical protein